MCIKKNQCLQNTNVTLSGVEVFKRLICCHLRIILKYFFELQHGQKYLEGLKDQELR